MFDLIQLENIGISYYLKFCYLNSHCLHLGTECIHINPLLSGTWEPITQI